MIKLNKILILILLGSSLNVSADLCVPYDTIPKQNGYIQGSWSFTEYYGYVNSHRREVDCLLLKVYKYFRANLKANQNIDPEVRQIALSLARQLDAFRLTLKYLPEPKHFHIGSEDPNTDFGFQLISRFNQLTMSEDDLINAISGYESDPAKLGIVCPKARKIDLATKIETDPTFDSMYCMPIRQLEVKEALLRLSEIINEANTYCENYFAELELDPTPYYDCLKAHEKDEL